MLCVRGTSHGPESVCVCLSVSVTSRSSTKTAKRRITKTTPHDSPGTLDFWCQRSPRSSTVVTPYEGAECRWVGQNRRLFTNSRISKTVGLQDRHIYFLLKSNRKSCALYRMVTLPMTLSAIRYDTIRDAILTCAPKADISQLNLPHGTDN